MMTCADHLSPASGFGQCLSCANANERTPTDQDKDTDKARTEDDSWTDDADSTYRYRSSYYDNNNYSPASHSFDRNDSRAFATTAAAGGLASLDEDGHPGFGDS